MNAVTKYHTVDQPPVSAIISASNR